MQPFVLKSEYAPAGDQPQAIDRMAASLRDGNRFQTLLGVTGSGKTFTLANVIEELQRPALVISHNKTLAAQLYSEFKSFFPDNAVEYFISYYDYYQPEAYIPTTDTYIEKDASINEEIERLRLAATSSLLERRDVICVASVSCIYGLGSPDDFQAMRVKLVQDKEYPRKELLQALIAMQYERNDIAPERGQFRVTGDTLDVFPSYREDMVRVELWGDTVEKITRRDKLTNELIESLEEMYIFPAKHFVMPYERIEPAIEAILSEMDEQVAKFEAKGKYLEAQRIAQRTRFDMEMLKELGYCSGIENYSRYLSGRAPGSKPYTLLHYFPDDFVCIVDESHITIPQVRAMFNADRNRKETLVEHGFRLPSALDNRPLRFEEFTETINQTVFVSATPADYERDLSEPIELVVRPTGLLDPIMEVRPLTYQVDDLVEEIRSCVERNERVLATTLTKRTAEDLAEHLRKLDLKVRYLHSEINAIERVELLRSLRTGDFDCLIGINLLREGLDLPEVALVAILDADKEGFLRSETALIQTAGRAARHLNGKVILYADRITGSMKRALDITNERREIQQAYNEKHGITPRSVKRGVQESLKLYDEAQEVFADVVSDEGGDYDVTEAIRQMEAEMQDAADALEFERAAMLRDQIYKLKKKQKLV